MKKSIIINERHHKKLANLSEQFKTNYGTLIEQMIDYFKKTGINPNDAINQNPSTLIKTLDKRIVSFLKVQERDILKPIRQEVYNYSVKELEQISELSKLLKILINRLDKNNRGNLENSIAYLEKKNSEKSKRLENLFIKQLQELKKQELAFYAIAELIDEKNRSRIQNKLKSLFS